MFIKSKKWIPGFERIASVVLQRETRLFPAAKDLKGFSDLYANVKLIQIRERKRLRLVHGVLSVMVFYGVETTSC